MDDSIYDLKSIKLPYFSGFLLRQFVSLIESPLSGLVLPQLLDSAGLTSFRQIQIDDAPVVHPLAYRGNLDSGKQNDVQSLRQSITALPENSSTGFSFLSVSDFAAAYQQGLTTPTEVAYKVLEAIKDSNNLSPPLRAIIASYADDVMQQAADSTERYSRDDTLGYWDGVPVAVKDEFDMVPYPTTVGTKFLGQKPAKVDATIVRRMREAGALLIGKTNMHEVGIGVTGFNAHHGTTRNPYNPEHYTGGSSSGPAAAVAAGLCPAALGADGGGSIRIPAAFCGVVGLKPTFGRVSEYGAAPLTWSMAHTGPIGATTADTALVYATIAGPDPQDAMSWHQPSPEVNGWQDGDIDGMTLGVFWPWFRHASKEIVDGCESALAQFEKQGAKIHDVEIPDLEAARVAHLVTIASEIAQSLAQYYDEHRKDFSYEVRTNLVLAQTLTASDYILSQRVRSRAISNFNEILCDVDIIVTPSTAIPSPRIPEKIFQDGDSDLSTLIEIMRYATVANLTGMPAISFPVGYTSSGLPIGFQGIGRAWDELSLLRLAQAAERIFPRKKPQIYYKLLDA